ncbi:hypothetical protein [Microcoleus sp. herbarium2]|uniref:hypothetical protein n=1 Tax=Microcoleus sp. herbarium2 TaxID=3055433 RepID=UPI002FD2B961
MNQKTSLQSLNLVKKLGLCDRDRNRYGFIVRTLVLSIFRILGILARIQSLA